MSTLEIGGEGSLWEKTNWTNTANRQEAEEGQIADVIYVWFLTTFAWGKLAVPFSYSLSRFFLPSPPFASSDPITLCGWSSSSVEEREGRRVPIFKLPIDQIAAAAYKWIRRPPETGCRRKERIKEEERNQKPNCKTLPNGLTNGWKGSHEWRAGQNERFWIQLWYWVRHTWALKGQ